MNKELFVSSTPHETKVGLVEDDLLAEVYLERENEYTLAGSIYKGRVTRVLPGMQSAFVDIGLERDAFLYVSDFMDLEEHDDDLTDVVPANRGVQDMRPQQANADNGGSSHPAEATDAEAISIVETDEGTFEADTLAEGQPASAAEGSESAPSGDSQQRDRGNFRGRRRRRGGRRDGRDSRDSRDRGPDRTNDRGGESSEQRYSRPAEPSAPRTHAAPPSGYQPILLPGESISKYQRYQQPSQTQEEAPRAVATESEVEEAAAKTTAPASSFPEDEPVFSSSEAIAEPLHEEHDHAAHSDEPVESASTSVDWNREFRTSELAPPVAIEQPFELNANAAPETQEDTQEETHHDVAEESHEADRAHERAEVAEHFEHRTEEGAAPVFAAPGTMEEETIDEDEADTVHFQASSDEGYDEFEEETQAADQHDHLNGDAREAVTEIHMASLTESGVVPAADAAHAEEDSEEIELEEAQAEAEAMLDAEARGNGTVDARAEVRAPATAGYTQRQPRQRPGYDRPGRGDRSRRGGGDRGRGRFRRRENSPVPLISDLLKEGQEILVQIAKEPIGKKGARITSHIALPGRFLVYMPTVNHTGVSRKISSEEERQRLKRIILSERENGHGGFIVRTAAQSASEEELRADIRFLKGLWQDIKNRAESSKPPALIYHDLNVVERVLRDQVTSDFSVIWVDTEPEYERILRFFNRFQPNMVKRVKLYTKEAPLFEQFGLKDEMDKALKSKVWLKSGGYIVINQTEALVAIDINTGKYVGKTARLEDTIVKTNVDAIKEIVRQIRLRDLGGIIIIDFIDMDERRNRQRVMQALEEELRHDRAPSKTLQFNDFGLVAITRKRVKQSLERTIGAPCPYCESTGYVKSVTTVCNEIYVEMRKIAKHLEHEDVMLRVHPDVAKELKGNNARLLNEMEEMTKRTIIVKSDPAVHQEQFDIN
ncbi:MAG TPA: Rne/Rng family ribonuclease [Candidatus Sulfotelmatobacter sp.]|jgi:ribonuclease G|nr:Rne/Rng family ribonuclease [Candidatus Sulfotelmatobacter sp.]